MKKSSPLSFVNSLIAQALIQRDIPRGEAEHLVAEAHRDAVVLAAAFSKPAASVTFFNTRHAAPGVAEEKAVARQSFVSFVNEQMQRAGCDYGRAWNQIAAARPDLYAQMNGTPQAQFANAAPGVILVAGHQLKALFRLPQTCSQDEFAAAYRGNDSAVVPFNPARALDGLVKWIQGQTQMDYEAALQRAKNDYPLLWKSVEQLARQPI